MLFLAILGLAAWVWWQSRRISELTRKVIELEQRLLLQERAPAAEERASPAPPATELEPLLLDQPLPPEMQEPLLLDTPLPLASNDDELVAESAAPTTAPQQAPLQLSVRAPATGKPRERKLEQWLAQNGLAWLGGVMLALGGVFLVSFASQQDWFTPRVQLACAALLAGALIGASEWARRAARTGPAGRALIAAMLAGAGVVTLYAAIWAAHALYGLIGWPAAAALLALCAAVLVGLSLLHGQALGVLAVLMALLAPPLASPAQWPSLGLTLYLCGVSAAGYGLAALKRWGWVAAAATAALYFWFSWAIVADDIRRALAIASFAALGGVAIAFRTPLTDEPAGRLTWTRTHTHLPAAAISVSSVLLIWTWLLIAPLPAGGVSAPAWVATMFVALAAAAVRARVAAPVALTISIAALVLGFMSYLEARYVLPAVGADFYPFAVFAAVAVVLAALGAHPHRTGRALIAGSGAIGAALLAALASVSRDDWHEPATWLPLFIGAALLLGAAWRVTRDAPDVSNDRAIDLYAGAAAALMLLGVESAFPASWRAAAHAGAAAVLAFGFAWRSWGVLRYAPLAAAVLSIGHALSPRLIGAVFAGELPLLSALAILALAAVLMFAASRFAARAAARAWSSEALSAAGVMLVLIGVFVLLRWVGAGGAGTPLDAFTETSLRVLALLAAGHVLMARPGADAGPISRWRGHALLGLGLLYVASSPLTALNPWWGATPAQVAGPALLDTLTLAFAAPAALALAAARRLYDHQRLPARIYAASGGVLLLTWALLELRRAFHGAEMASAPIGLFEAACYALLLLAYALALAFVARSRAARGAERPFTQDLVAITRGCAWVAIIASTLILLTLRHPWWGAQDPTTSNAFSTLLAVLAQAVAVVLTLYLGRALSRSREVEPTRFAAASAAPLFAWSFGHAAIRWFYHRGYMDHGAPLIQLEGLFHALWPLAFVLGAAAIAARAPGRDTVRAYLYDLQAICASAIWPALVFAALGFALLFAPWWGLAPGDIAPTDAALLALTLYVAAAWMSAAAIDVPHLRRRDWFVRAATVAVALHLFVALTLSVRRLFHAEDVGAAPVGDMEMWAYSAVWAVFGAGAFVLGMSRNSAMLRWIGLAVLIGAWLYVVLLSLTQLRGLAQIGAMIGLASVLLIVAWLARANRLGAPPKPTDLSPITPSARRERRYGRR